MKSRTEFGENCKARREILIKAVIQAIPSYATSVFRFPAGLCQEITSMANRYWWGQCQGERKIHWLNKKHLVQQKMQGGIGFRDLQLFNKALLAKQGWRLIQNPASLVCRILKSKYFPRTTFLEATVLNNPSYLWRSILVAKDVLNMGLRWRVGTGSKINIWKDPWLLCSTTYRVISPVFAQTSNNSVDSLIDAATMTWNKEKIEAMFLPRDSELIQQIPLSIRRPSDILIWSSTTKGEYIVKSAYHMLFNQQNNSEPTTSTTGNSNSGLWRAVWKAQVQPKPYANVLLVLLFFIWSWASLEKCDAALNIGVPTIKWRAPVVHGGDFFQEHARTILVGLRFALDIGIFRVEVEEGCSDLIGMVQKGSPCLAANGVLVDDICGFIPNFQFISFSFVKNICNKVATALATEALSSTSESSMVGRLSCIQGRLHVQMRVCNCTP
uniref:RNase H type-1 domain-containing protein n=1 Tax=Fagus sylvatica TaxID=28930 RepID=A0A2N9ED45_FAGSY